MLGRASVTLNGGVFSAPAGMQAFSGQLALAQAVWDRQFDRWGLTVAGGIFNIDGDPENQDAQRSAEYTSYSGELPSTSLDT